MSEKEVKRETTAAIAKRYEPTPDEHAAMKAVRARSKKTPRVKVTDEKGMKQISLDHPDQKHGYALLGEALATGEIDFVGELLSQLGNAAAQDGKLDERKLNYMIAVIKVAPPQSTTPRL